MQSIELEILFGRLLIMALKADQTGKKRRKHNMTERLKASFRFSFSATRTNAYLNNHSNINTAKAKQAL